MIWGLFHGSRPPLFAQRALSAIPTNFSNPPEVNSRRIIIKRLDV